MEALAAISNILKENYDVSQEIDLKTNLIDEFGFESISMVELASLLGEKLNMDITASMATKWTDIASIKSDIKTLEKKDVVKQAIP